MSDVRAAPGSTSQTDAVAALDVLARALSAMSSTRAVAGSHPSPQEGLALVQSFVAIEDADLRRAVLAIAAALATRNPR